MRQTGSAGTSGGIPVRHRLGALRITTHAGAAGNVLRTPPPDPADDTAPLYVGTQPEGHAVLAYGATLLPCAPGEVFVADPAQPWELRARDDFRLHLFVFPRDLLGLPDADLTALRGVHGRSGGGVTRLLVPLLTTVAESAPDYAPATAHGIAGSLAELLGTLATERRTTAPTAPGTTVAADAAAGPDRRAVTARAIRRFVNENLADRRLSPEYIAARHHVSVRYVHKVFAAEGTTLGRWIRQRRLQECRRELARPDRADAASLAAVARRWGFANAAHFSRSFRAAYGVSPGEWHRIRTGTADRGHRATGTAPGA
ncbi:helix-turn-helix domain-containing protein [Streptomyces sp. NPDC001595]|uniref:helix-turn-helix domain-containing protein n=1 Tax=Streptomyces sp. NPDC001532 TaxID=3154520 RepID=UPI0033243B8E